MVQQICSTVPSYAGLSDFFAAACALTVAFELDALDVSCISLSPDLLELFICQALSARIRGEIVHRL